MGTRPENDVRLTVYLQYIELDGGHVFRFDDRIPEYTIIITAKAVYGIILTPNNDM